jgi:hypothetical protein
MHTVLLLRALGKEISTDYVCESKLLIVVVSTFHYHHQQSGGCVIKPADQGSAIIKILSQRQHMAMRCSPRTPKMNVNSSHFNGVVQPPRWPRELLGERFRPPDLITVHKHFNDEAHIIGETAVTIG